jgi:hypothetical protein
MLAWGKGIVEGRMLLRGGLTQVEVSGTQLMQVEVELIFPVPLLLICLLPVKHTATGNGKYNVYWYIYKKIASALHSQSSRKYPQSTQVIQQRQRRVGSDRKY